MQLPVGVSSRRQPPQEQNGKTEYQLRWAAPAIETSGFIKRGSRSNMPEVSFTRGDFYREILNEYHALSLEET